MMRVMGDLGTASGEGPFAHHALASSLDHRGPQIPSIHIDNLSDPDAVVRGRGATAGHSIEMSSFGARSSLGEGEERLLADGGLRPRRSSPNPSRRPSLLSRLGTLGAPSRNGPGKTSTRRGHGRQYDILGGDEADDEHFAIDLSTLAGNMGYQLNEAPSPTSQDRGAGLWPESAPSGGSLQPAHSSRLTSSRSKLGKGMVVGAQLKLDPSLAAVRRAVSSARSPVSPVDGRSIDDIGQHLAQKRQVIVEVDEPFDLGSLEGAELDRQARRRVTNSSFEDMQASFKPADSAIKSYFYPTDPDHPNWKPVSMRSYYIGMLVGVSLGLGIFQEWLCRHSQALAAKDQGILQFDNVSSVPLFYFITWHYMPTFIFVVYGVLWSIMDFDIKRLEPYYQLSQPTGSTAAASLNLDHLTAWSYFVPFTAMKLRQWAVFFSSIGNIIATSIAPSLQNPSIILIQNPNWKSASKGTSPQPQFFVRVSPNWSRALTSCLVITAAIGGFLLIKLRRKSGLLSDPKGISGIAAMATKSHILADFQGTDIATRREIHQKIQHRRFVLYKSSIWPGAWNRATEPSPESLRKSESTHPLMLRLQAGIPFMALMGLCLILIPIINFTPANVIPNSQPWLPVLAASLIKMVWTTFESDVRLMEPFYILSKGRAPPQMSLTLDYQGTVYGWMPIKASLNGHYLVALVGLCSVLLDILTVTVSSFSVNTSAFLHGPGSGLSNQDQTFTSFWSSVTLSIAILSFSIIAAALVYARRRHPFLPREPSTIAAVLAFIYASNMLDDFIDTERYTNKQMEAMLKSKLDANGRPKSYGLGWFKGRDGIFHCAIDEEPMRSKYVHGKPYSLAHEPWAGSSDPAYV